MAEKKETTFKKRVLAFLASLPNTWYAKIQQVCLRGVPDILACIGGCFVGIELKKDIHSRLDPLQKYNLQKISEANGIAIVAFPENWDAIKVILIELSKGEKDETKVQTAKANGDSGGYTKAIESLVQNRKGKLQGLKARTTNRARAKAVWGSFYKAEEKLLHTRRKRKSHLQ